MNDILNNAVERFLENYDDVMKNFPIDGQKQVSRYYEIDCRHSHVVNKLEKYIKRPKDFTSTDEERIKKMLMESLDLADRKVNITECLLDMVGTNMRNLTMSFKEAEAAKLNLINSNKRKSKQTLDHKEIDSDSIDVQNINNSNKRPRRNVSKLSTTLNKNVEMNAHFGKKTSTNQNKKKPTSNKKSKVQPARKKKIVSGSESFDSDADGDDSQPTYCICEEISYGDMVGCDNDLCPLEWCHFGCVSISKKPKGKWYCPFCRGTNSKTMMPKPAFLKKLEEYNKRKEENWSPV